MPPIVTFSARVWAIINAWVDEQLTDREFNELLDITLILDEVERGQHLQPEQVELLATWIAGRPLNNALVTGTARA